MHSATKFVLEEATIETIHSAYQARTLTVRKLVEIYLERIAHFDKQGPALNAIISLNPNALTEADRLDAQFSSSGRIGPLHGIPIVAKDQIDIEGLPTTLGSVLFANYTPTKDSFVVARLRKAGAVFLGKATLGELGGGDTHGSLFGSTRNVYDLERTAGGSSGGSAVCVSANFCTVALAQEGFSSIRRPAIWNGVVGMRPTVGLVSRSGVYGGWPTCNGSVGPMARCVTDLAKLLDSMTGYDKDDPVTARSVSRTTFDFSNGLKKFALRGARLGILREPVGYDTDPGSEDFTRVEEAFDRSVEELRNAGAELIDPLNIPDLRTLLATRARDTDADDAMFERYFANGPAPFATRADVLKSPLFDQVHISSQRRFQAKDSADRHYRYLRAREALMTNLLNVMAEYKLDAIVHKAVEHQPTRIKDGTGGSFVDQKGAIHINTFLMYVPSIVVPAGFTNDDLPVGITFLGRPYDDARMIQFAYSYEQATNHRRPPLLA